MHTKHVDGVQDAVSFNKEVDDLFTDIFNENPKYWNAGLGREQFNGVGDRIILFRDPSGKTKKPLGFFGIQKYRRDHNGKLVHALSIALKPELRNKGLAKHMVTSILPLVIDKDDNTDLLWNVNKDNIPSQKLFNSVAKALRAQNKLKNNFRLQFDAD